MKQIFTLFAMGMLCLCASESYAQINQSFEPVNSASPLPALTSNCWSFSGAGWDNTSKMTGTGALNIIPTTSSSTNLTSNNAKITTPFIDFQDGNLISLKYKLSSKLSTQAERVITLRLLDRDGNLTTLTSATLDKNTPATVFTLSAKLSLSTLTPLRLVIDVNGNGDGNSYLYLDDLSIAKGTKATVQPTFHYNPSNCNTPPVAGDNTYNPLSNTAAYPGASVLNNDSDPNGESISITSYTQPAGTGTVVMNADGTFTFTPRTDTTFTFTSFTYTIRDNGYERLSATATVYLYFPQVTTLPLHLLHFSATAGTQTVLTWKVASNESGTHFEVQRNSGRGYKNIAMVLTSEKTGNEQYQYSDVVTTASCHYRLKLVNKDGTSTYSNAILVGATTADEKITLLQNPVQNKLSFTVLQAAAVKQILIYNAAGGMVYVQKTSLQKDNNRISLPLASNLARGIYFLEVVTTSGSKTIPFVKQ